MASSNRHNISRRQFFETGARSLCGAGLVGAGLFLFSEQTRPTSAYVLRPPGAENHDRFLDLCVRCGQCVQACPYDTLKLATAELGASTGTPYFVARDVPCEMCDDIPCVQACPTDALDKKLSNIDDSKMGIAVLFDHENCLNFKGLRCDQCYRECPLIDEAITLEMQRNARTGSHATFIPTVHTDKCTGCGKCERVCVLDEAAIKVFPVALVEGRQDEHYRFGWEEMEKAGGSLIPELIELPTRLPQGGIK